MNLSSVAEEIQHRIIHLFGRDVEGRRATNGGSTKLDYDPHFRDYVWFHEVLPVLSLFTHFVLMDLPSPSPFLKVLPRRLWQRFGCLAPNWVVSSVPHLWIARVMTCVVGLDSLRIIFYRAGSTAGCPGHPKVS